MIIGNKIYQKEKCYNSLEWAKEKLNTAPDGSIFLADVHEYTKGRQSRIWKQYKGQLLITILLKPTNLNIISDLPLRLNQLNMSISLGILEPLKKYNVVLKWPNDFMINTKKIGGIITQIIWENNNVTGIIFGFSINVNNIFEKSDELYPIATSLKSHLNKTIDKKELLQDLLKSIDNFYKLWLNLKFDEIYKLYKNNQNYLKKEIRCHKSDKTLIEGIFYDLLENGNIVIKTKNENNKIISFNVIENLDITQK